MARLLPLLALLATLLATVLAALASCDSSEATVPPSVIVISLDTCRPDRLTPYGAERDNSPALAGFSREAVVWTDCIAQSTSTAPSHRSLFTGQYVHRHGMHRPALVVPSYNLASLLRERGYATAAFTGGGYVRSQFGFDFGFDRFQAASPLGAGEEDDLRGLTEVLPAAQRWLARQGERPFFLFVHAYDVHSPYWPPQPYRERYAGWYRGELPAKRLAGRRDFDRALEAGAIGPDELRYIGDLYDAGIAASDELLGGFFDFLRSERVLDRAVVVFTSDHGESLGEHGWIGHASTWEEQARVPLVIRFPGARWAGVRDEPAELVDVLPTLLAFLDVPAPDGVQGVDLTAALRGEPAAAKPMRLTALGDWEVARFDGRWKLVLERRGEELVEAALYDLAQDPGETRDLRATEDGRRRAAELRARYESWRRETAAADARHRGVRARAVRDPGVADELRALGYVDAGEDE